MRGGGGGAQEMMTGSHTNFFAIELGINVLQCPFHSIPEVDGLEGGVVQIRG